MSINIIQEDSTPYHIADNGNGDKSILKILQENKIYIDAPCNSNGKCGKCKAKITGEINPVTPSERKLLTVGEIDSGIRLACLTYPLGECQVKLLTGNIGVQSEGKSVDYEIAPRFLADKKNSQATAVGMAVDIGTTTVACYFYNLVNGQRLYTASGMNKQRAYGADVISRIDACIQNENGLSMLQSSIVNELNGFIAEFCQGTEYTSEDIKDAVIAGNTVMLHLLTSYDPKGIATAPFTPTSLFGFDIDAKTIGLNMASNAQIYLTNCISGYVGGDITAGMISSGVDMLDEPCIFIDIGTNGEMSIGNKDGFTCCATAAGPAFEGAHIKYGCGGISGAIDRVLVNNGDITVTTINGLPPIGICGSGLISAIDALVKLGVIDETGRIDEDEINENLMYRFKEDDEAEFILDVATGISITQKDIREVQLAKAAIAAGINTLIHSQGITYEKVGKVILAGGFGSYIDKKSACAIGLLPLELLNKIETVGNAAGMGAVKLLLNSKSIEKISSIAKNTKYYELSGDSYFQDEYIEQICF